MNRETLKSKGFNDDLIDSVMDWQKAMDELSKATESMREVNLQLKDKIIDWEAYDDTKNELSANGD